ncbi:MAG: OmpA family protein [Acidobacteria bacterium]|nr:OmpA family protein [Acidobacteriota bacterium]
MTHPLRPFVFAWMSPLLLFALGDKPGCKDHPLVTRMPGYEIVSCESNAFGTHRFNSREGGDLKYLNPEGKLTELKYSLPSPQAGQHLSKVTLVRNYQNALRAVGGKVIYDNPEGGITVVRLSKEGRETYVEVKHYSTTYTLVVLEQGALEQAVTASHITTALEAHGRIALYGITFDFNKADLKPDSEAALKAMSEVLKASPDLKVHIVGHTDNVGDHLTNLRLSKARAESVAAALTGRFGIQASRLSAEGVAALCPVATQATEAGRALNRRVEMVRR